MELNKQKKDQSKQIVISDDVAGQRIDNFLIRYLGKIPKSRVYQMLLKGEVRVNRGRIKQTYKLNSGDIVRIPPVFVNEKITSIPPDSLQQRVIDSIIYEDDSLIIINKPSGIVVHSGSEQVHGVIEAIRARGGRYEKLELVHRLDKETSGCLILAKNIPSLRKLNRAIQSDEMTKIYTALLAGRLEQKEITVDQPLYKNTLRSGERIVRVDRTGKKAITKFFREQLFENATLVSIELMTGRTHQIRVHGAYMNHPVIGDHKYGDRKINSEFKKLGLKRLFLHAQSLKFISPASNKLISIEAPLDPALSELLKAISIKEKN